jgi:two-component system nitrate/nitrite response regulator NarL
MGNKLRVLVADDHPLFLFAIAHSIEAREELQLVGQAATGREAVALARQQRPDLAVLDVQMPDLSGLEVLKAITREGLRTRVLFVAGSLDAATAHDLVEAGAAGVLEKDALPEQIGDALVRIAGGETVVAPQIEAQLREHPHLSRREAQVLRFLADGLSAPQIAAELDVAPSTVKTHLQRLYDRLEVSDRAAAVAEGMRRGLID